MALDGMRAWPLRRSAQLPSIAALRNAGGARLLGQVALGRLLVLRGHLSRHRPPVLLALVAARAPSVPDSTYHPADHLIRDGARGGPYHVQFWPSARWSARWGD